MKILYINTYDNVGGCALFMLRLGSKIKERGHHVKYLVGYKKSDQEDVYGLTGGWLINWIAKKTRKDIGFMLRGLITKFLANDIDYGANEEILNHPWYKEADIVHCNNLHGHYFRLETLETISKEKKTIWTLHDEWAIMAHGSSIFTDKVIGGFFRRENRNTYPAMLWNNEEYLADRKRAIYKALNIFLTVPSLWLRDLVGRSVLGDKPVELIHHGIDTEVFKKSDKSVARKRHNIPDNKKVVMFISGAGKTNPLKGSAYIEKLTNYYKDDKGVCFIGIGGEKGENGMVRNLGYIKSSEELASYYSAADVFVLTSLVESFSLTTIEALSCGLPVVAFPVGVVPEIIAHKKNGYIAKHLDAQDLIRGVEHVLGLPAQQLKEMSSYNIGLVKKEFSIDLMVDRYLSIYSRLFPGVK